MNYQGFAFPALWKNEVYSFVAFDGWAKPTFILRVSCQVYIK